MHGGSAGGRRVTALAALAAGLALAGGWGDRRAVAQVPSFTGEVRVEEEAIVLQPPADRFWRPDGLDPHDLLVSEDGMLRRVTRIEPLADSGRHWTQVVYVDRRLAPPETVFLATLALAKRAQDLAALGPVEVVVADPAPRTVLRPTREARRIELVLADLAGAARIERDRAGDRRVRPPAEEQAATARRQYDRLLVDLTARHERGPHALFLIAETGLAEAAPLLAGYGWLTVPMPVRRGEIDGSPPRPQSDSERAWRNLQEGWNTASVPPLIEPAVVLPPRRRGTLGSLPMIAELYVTPDLAPLRELVTSTGGHLLGYEEQLGPALAALGARWQVWLEVVPAAPAGTLRRLEIQTIRGDEARTFRWRRSSTPPEVTEARLRLLLAGEPAGAPPLGLRGAPGEARRMTIDLGPFRPATGGGSAGAGAAQRRPAGPFRISVATGGAEGAPAIAHTLLAVADLAARDWMYELQLTPSPVARRLAVVVEDLAAERWLGAAATLPGHS